MQRAEVDLLRREWAAAEPQRARGPASVDAVRHLAVFGQPVQGIVADDVRLDANRLGTVRPGAHLGHRPLLGEGEDAPLLAAKLVSHMLPLMPKVIV